MRRANLIVLIALLLAGCAAPATEVPTPALTDQQPTAAAGPPTAAPMPTSLPTPTVAVPTAPPTVPPAATQPTAAPATPTDAPLAPTAAPATPTDAPLAPTAAPAAPAPTAAPLNPQDQAAALLPGFAGDLGRAGEWNRYTISAAIDPAARTIAGGLRLEYTNRDSVALDRLYFHLYPNLPDFGGRLAAANLAVDGTPVELVYEAGRFLLRVNLPHPLAPGASATVTMDFSTAAPENASRNRYGAFNKESGVLSLASSYPTVAIVRRGDWDLGRPDPQGDFVNSETALYDVTLTAPPDWPLATTGVAVASQPGDGGRQTQRFVSGPQRDFMIVATQLARESAMVDGTRINSYYRPEQASRGQAALQAAAGALRAFNKRFGAYPLAELDVVEVNAGNFLGVEYPGLIEIEHNLYAGGDGLEITVAHEVAHQWWYSQVGNNPLTEAWLDEALASYAQIVYQEEVHGPDAAAGELEGFRQRYRRALAEGRDAPVARPTSAFRGNYVALVYGKAVLFFQAMREQIGDEAFDRFLRERYARHRYAYIGGADLLADAEGACRCDLHPLYESWITQAAPVEMP